MMKRENYLGQGGKAAFVHCTPLVLPRDSNFVSHAVVALAFSRFLPTNKEKRNA